MKINQIHHYPTNYHVLKYFQDLSIFLSKMYNLVTLIFLILHKK